MLKLHEVAKSFRGENGDVRAVDCVSLAVDAGQFVAVQGPSGCGKSTLLLISGGLLAPDQGTVEIDGESPYALPTDQRARFRASKVGFVFQQFHLIPYLSVHDNILAPAIAGDVPDARSRTEDLISRFGLQNRAQHVPGHLSTGERQRTALARALLNQPKLILADEPTGNLDHDNAGTVLGYLNDFAAEGGAVLLVTHDDRAVQYADKVVQIRDGKLAADS